MMHAGATVINRPGATIGQRVLVYDELTSTNETAKDLSQDTSNHGTVVVARYQSQGRGQYGRVWQAAANSSLLFSVVLHPPLSLRRAVVLTAWATVALGDAMREVANIQARIKWPNDLYAKGKKLAGVLIEQGAGVVCGVGVNLNQTANDFTNAELPDAISLSQITNRGYEDPLAVLEPILNNLSAGYDYLQTGDTALLESDWKWRLGLLGRTTTATLHDGSQVTGRVMDMSFSGINLVTAEGPRVLLPEHVKHFSRE